MEYVKPYDAAAKVVIPHKVTIDDVTYKVTSIAADAFKNDKKLIKVSIGKNVKNIEANAFFGCTGLKMVNM